MSKDEILQHHHSVMVTFGISLPELNFTRIRTLKQRYIAGSAVLNQASFSDSNTNPDRS